MVIKLQAVITNPAYDQAISHADLYDDVRIQVNILGCLESSQIWLCFMNISEEKKDFICCDLVENVN